MSIDYNQKIIVGYKVPKSKIFQNITKTVKSQSCKCNKDKSKFCPICGKEWEESEDEEILDVKILIPELYDEEDECINTQNEKSYDVVATMSEYSEYDFCIVGKTIFDADETDYDIEISKLDIPTKEKIDKLIRKLPIKDYEFGLFLVNGVY